MHGVFVGISVGGIFVTEDGEVVESIVQLMEKEFVLLQRNETDGVIGLDEARADVPPAPWSSYRRGTIELPPHSILPQGEPI